MIGGAPVAVVGLGASAGGVQVLEAVLQGVPADSGLAFVVVMHLSPDFESSLAEILQRRTSMVVQQVEERVRIKPNCVYVIPPTWLIAMEDSHIVLTQRHDQQGQRVAIDLFFRTLAAAYGQSAVCAVLSGMDSDGIIGLKHIKEQGGVTIAQDPGEAPHSAMPLGAIATGMVDWVLKAEEIGPRLAEFAHNELLMRLPPEDSADGNAPVPESEKPGGPVVAAQVPSAADEEALREILVHLRQKTGHDFGHYKRATVLRRIARRMQVNRVPDLLSYLEVLREAAPEANELLHDLLINVTNFFRDPSAFATLEAHIPQLLAGKTADDQLRVWVCGCATGEEAYSIAMLLHEHASKLLSPPSLQIFATDLDNEAIHIARAGVYPQTIEADVSPERLQRFFVLEMGRYRVRQEIRDRVLFATHDVLKDSPFSRLDMVSCRNMLIYLKREAQERVFDIFHFSLRPGGLLFLGSSESLDETHMLFAPLVKTHRLYARRALARPTWQIPIPLPSSLPASGFPTLSAPRRPSLPSPNAAPSTWGNAAQPAGTSQAEAPVSVGTEGASATAIPASGAAPVSMGAAVSEAAPVGERRTLSYGDLHLQILERYAPPSVIVNENYDVMHLSEHAGRYLQPVGGELSVNLLKLVHPGLRIELRTALFRAAQSNREVSVPRVPIEMGGVARLVSIHVRPSLQGGQGFVLVLFDDVTDAASASGLAAGDEAGRGRSPQVLERSDTVSRHLEEELHQLKEQLTMTVEQHEAAAEELKASNEELQAMNEELRSATEELQTSKEELQSVNEELTTVNHEMRSNLDELGRLNSDLQNLLTSTEIGTIFLDRQFRIKRFTPRAQDLFNLIPTDIGRPLSDITHRLEYEGLSEDAAQVLRSLSTVEREVHAAPDTWFIARLLPYRTLDDRIDGVVLTFVDITQRKKAEDALRTNEERLRGQKEAFQAAMGGAALGQSLDILARLIAQETAGEARTAFYIADPQGAHLYTIRGAGNMSEVYADQIDGFIIGQDSLACGLAIPTGRPVITRDVLEDPLWRPWMEIAQQHDFRACWSFPIKTRNNSGVGTLAMYFRTPRDATARDLALADIVTRSAAVIIDSFVQTQERARAEAALRASEAKYRSLFETMDEGFCLMELVLDEQGGIGDIICREANAAFKQHAGLDDAVGKRASEIFPRIEQLWLEAVARVYRTGLPERTEGHNADTNRWITTHYSRVGGVGSLFVAAVFNDITESKQRQQQQEFLLNLADALRSLSDPLAIEREALRVLRAHLGAPRAIYAEALDEEGTMRIVAESLEPGLVPMEGLALRFSDFTPGALDQALDGHPLWREDVLQADHTPEEQRGYSELGTRAWAMVPLVKEGRLVALLAIYSAQPRAWTAGDLGLIQETTERTWATAERARAENALRQSEEQLLIAIEAAQMGTWNWHIDTDQVFWNERHFTMLGMEPRPGPVTPQTFFDHIHEDDRTRVMEQLEHAIAQRSLFHAEFRARTKQGQVRWMEGHGQVFEIGQDGQPIRMSGAMIDITERKEAEERLRASEARFRTMTDAVPQVIWVNDAQGTVTYFNSRWFEYSGLSLGDSRGLGWQAIVHPDDAPASVERWQQALAAGQVFDTEYRLRHADGQYRWFIGRNVPLKDEAGQVLGWFGSATDIDDLKRVEAQLRQSEERFRVLVEGTEDYAILLMDTARRILHWNPGAAKIFGWSRQEALGQNASLIYTAEDRKVGILDTETQLAIREGRAADTRWHIRRDGSRLWAEGVVSALYDAQGQVQGFAKIARDATKEHQADEMLQKAYAELEERVQQRTAALSAEIERRQHLEAERERLLRGLVAAQEEERRRLSRELHDQMGQTLTALMLGLKMLPVPTDPSPNQSSVQSLHKLQTLASELIDQAHSLAWELRPAVLDNIGLEAALKQYVLEWARRVGVSADFIAHGHEGRERFSVAVESALYRVVQEALTNVARHAQASQVSVLLEQREQRVRLLIEDDGQGFDPQQSTSRLGLIGMRERLEMIAGTLTIESSLGEGTTLYVEVDKAETLAESERQEP
jgi:PAS domain S-box-containing protein